MKINFILNGKDVSVNCRPDDRLSTILREHFNLLNIKNGCLSGECGNCSLIFNNKIVTSCLIPAFSIKGAEIITEKGLSKFKERKIIDDAFKKMNCELCDYCRSGRYIAIHNFLEQNKHNKISQSKDILNALSWNSCDCIDPYTFIEVIRECQKTRTRNKHVFER